MDANGLDCRLMLKTLKAWSPALLVAGSVLVSALVIWISLSRSLTGLESTLFQVFILTMGLVGSFVLGQRSAREFGQESIRPSVRSAFRRVLSLYEGLGRLRHAVDERRDFLVGVVDPDTGLLDMRFVDACMDVLAAQVIEQITTANDSMSDWRDLVPDEVARLERRLNAAPPVAEGETIESR